MSEKLRLPHIDALKGLAILFMVQVHTVSFVQPDGISLTHPLAVISAAIGGMAAPLFVTLSGWGVFNSLEKRAGDGSAYRWGFVRICGLLFFQLIVNLLLPQRFLWYTPGVLSLLAICTGLAILVSKFKSKQIIIFSTILFIAAPSLFALEIGQEWSWVMRVESTGLGGWFERLLVNGTYPVLPWAAFFFSGAFLKSQSTQKGVVYSSAIALSLVAYSGLLSWHTGVAWAATSGSGVLTFFPANPLFVFVAASWVHFIWYLSLRFQENLKTSFSLLAPAGRLSLSIYVLHFVTLSLIANFGPGAVSLEYSFMISMGHSLLGIPLAMWHQKTKPNLSFERLFHSLSSPKSS